MSVRLCRCGIKEARGIASQTTRLWWRGLARLEDMYTHMHTFSLTHPCLAVFLSFRIMACHLFACRSSASSVFVKPSFMLTTNMQDPLLSFTVNSDHTATGLFFLSLSLSLSLSQIGRA